MFKYEQAYGVRSGNLSYNSSQTGSGGDNRRITSSPMEKKAEKNKCC